MDRIAARLISRLKGGVQPAFRGGARGVMFGDDAPIWRFLRSLDLQQDPIRCRTASDGRFAIEVFPALALPALIPELVERGRGAKYNPSVRKFTEDDWRIVCDGLASAAERLGLGELARWSRSQGALEKPRKGDQDRLDAAICLLIATHWRLAPPEDGLMIGDLATGYVVTPTTPAISIILAGAQRSSRPIRGTSHDAGQSTSPDIADQEQKTVVRGVHQMAAPVPDRRTAERVDPIALRAILIAVARQQALLTYGDVAAALGFRFHQGFVASLLAAFRTVSRENIRRGEPQLMGLVVSKGTGTPGAGFFSMMRSIGRAGETDALFRQERERCFSFNWPDRAPTT
ncbi:hypothetical protein NFI95_12435 [Acetobacteraceae bacterium KSS8]|uniref:Uncharacterized protein n=1 Tax=Endosaccharibacter trunci TaxID=2812733 RepID=A0ABT1W8M9_9PROT|nr:hypothetical protein [Acetobacteraceae bacterium KSS8]